MRAGARALLMAVAAAAAAALGGPARAQTLRLSANLAGTVPGTVAWTDPGAPVPGVVPSFGVAVLGAKVGDTDVSLGLRLEGVVGGGATGGETTAGRVAQLDLALRANDTFGPLGNVIGEAALSVRTDATAEGSLGARGVLGPVALGVRWVAFGADPARFDPLAAARDDRPTFGAAGWGVTVDAAGRPSRSLILEGAPELFVVPGGVAGRLEARLRWLRAVGPHELSLRLRGYLGPGALEGDAAVGAGLTYRRPREPDLDAALYLGLGPDGWRPGATAALAQPLAGGARLELDASAEPYRVDVPPYRVAAGASLPLAGGTGRLSAALAAGHGPPSAALQASLDLPVDLP